MERTESSRLHRLLNISLLVFSLSFLNLSAQAGEVTHLTDPDVSKFFDWAKKNEAALIAFLHKMPKGADLHNHPSGAVYTETIVDNAIGQGLYFDRELKAFVRLEAPPSKSGRYYSSNELKSSFWKMGEALDALSMRNMDKQLESGHDHFFRSFERFGPALPTPEQMVEELIDRATGQNISYMELMIDPVKSSKTGEADIDATVALIRTMNKAKRNLLESRKNNGAVNSGVDIAYILTLNRNSLPKQEGQEYAAFFREKVRDTLKKAALGEENIHGVTILSAEDAWASRTLFDTQFKIIDEEWSRLQREYPGRPKMNLHGGELTLEYSPYSVMRDRITRTINEGHASRIGHGVDVMWEDGVYGLLERMKKEKIAVEICLTSNQGILGVYGKERHPFPFYWKAGVPLVLSTDDEGISRSNLTMEYAKATTWFDLNYGELKWLAFNSLEYSFLPGESLFIDGDFNRPKTTGQLPQKSAKADIQQRLMEDFSVFENNMRQNMKVFFPDGLQ